MLRIAIVDDTVEVCYRIEGMLYEISESIDDRILTEHYYNGEALCEDLGSGKAYDIILLDIEMENTNGIQTARYIREGLGNALQQIVFISAKRQYSLELHSFHPLDFLLKPVGAETLGQVIKEYLRISGKWNDLFSYKKGRGMGSVRIRDIKYVTVTGRLIYLVMKSGDSIEFYGTLEKVFSESLKKHGFRMIHKQFIVNPYYVMKYEYEQVIMDDGTKLPIGSSRRKEIRELQLAADLRGYSL